MLNNDTIAAIATAPGTGGIGVVRVSGKKTKEIAGCIIGELAPKRMAGMRTFTNAAGDSLDSGLTLYFEGPDSYTGEDVLELQGHGGPGVLRLILRACIEAGARLAQPGEFTQRAYLNNKLDLAQAESVADLIGASSEAAVLSAHRSLSGEFSGRTEDIRRELIETRVFVEAAIDFAEEEIDFLKDESVKDRLSSILQSLGELRDSATQGNLLREGAKVVLAGEPNVGKSTLMNLLSEEETSIVTEYAGTTRDSIQRQIIVGGIPMTVVDTAGLRKSDDPIESIGIQRTLDHLKDADVIVYMQDAGNDADRQRLISDFEEAKSVIVLNKIDLMGREEGLDDQSGVPVIYLSAKTGAGLEILKKNLLEKVGARLSEEAPFMARERHLNALDRAVRHLSAALANIAIIEFCAEELRAAQDAISEITGEFVADDLLGEIFSSFCVGK
ncbi:MAG: tRNA uridine-5-carboxymethylaminomethyl(34) synthesis GTPase MnmE [Proteobacteria bacterium]|nr:tRNA uridine-5-carboxymethylaminomethyl(34) synthesis GTPase MnmE [Pseudomonadota bacterium]MDA0862081.1 tRNA uridine-5-carboxymethylaminomethyl(34) synthesis GTPase MnmE [Pseudomonadota bacterium]MDA1030121.1 tRNA uridine-5-carboxymethylaminomethyl(34) synthesis GTPase MnmE [Pseudomonadota bacterium]